MEMEERLLDKSRRVMERYLDQLLSREGLIEPAEARLAKDIISGLRQDAATAAAAPSPYASKASGDLLTFVKAKTKIAAR